MDVPVTPRNEPFSVPPEKSKGLTNPAGLSRHAGVIVGDDVRKLFEYARANKFAIPAINVCTTTHPAIPMSNLPSSCAIINLAL